MVDLNLPAGREHPATKTYLTTATAPPLPSAQGALCMQVQPIQPVEVDSSTYHYEDYLADMGNSASTEHASEAGGPPVEAEANHIGRLQAITGAKAVETKVKPRGPRAEPADYEFILVCSRAGVGTHTPTTASTRHLSTAASGTGGTGGAHQLAVDSMGMLQDCCEAAGL